MEDALALVAEASTEHVGRWNRLVSTTNWQKGRIILEWRQSLEAASLPAGAYTDESWACQVGGITPQHVGRLRRVYQRFGSVCEDYAGLYWSHFQAAVDWSDAEMWLEGAVQNRWSVARMCDQRWEALGSPAESQPQEADFLAGDVDEDMPPEERDRSATISESFGEVHGEADAYFDGDDAEPSDRNATAASQCDATDSVANAAAEPVRPFEAMPTLPPDMSEAFDLFKLAILNHKVSGWQEIARDDVLRAIDSLKQLALAPAG